MAFTNVRFGTVGAVFLFILLITSALLYLYYPAVPHSVLGWIALFVIGLPTWFLLEWLGTVVLGAKVFSRMSSPARIAIGVPVVISLVVVAVFLVRLGQSVIAGA